MNDDINKIYNFLQSSTGRLTSTYLAIIVALTVMYSGVIYVISASQFDRPPRPGRSLGQQFDAEVTTGIEELFAERAEQAKIRVLWSLLLLNIVTTGAGAYLSYYLARKTLLPIQRAMDAQSQFISDASHELRTPLTALLASNEVALRKKKLSILHAKETIEQNVHEVNKLRDLTSSLLALVTADGTAKQSEVFNLRDAVRNGLETVIPLALRKNISVTDTVPSIFVFSNLEKLAHVIKIITENAIKYSPESSTVTISASVRDGKAVLSIADQGPGIAANDQAKVFERFYRVDSSRSSQQVEGYGLGLSIAKAIADLQGIGIAIESDGVSGTIFRVEVETTSD